MLLPPPCFQRHSLRMVARVPGSQIIDKSHLTTKKPRPKWPGLRRRF